MTSILYISYDGLTEPLGQSQIIAYIEKLADEHEIFVISFEKPFDLASTDHFTKIHNRLTNVGIKWIPMKYHKKPTVIASMYDIFRGIFVATYISKKNNIKILHARSYIPALIGLFVKKFLNVKLLFDIRGFWADERVDGGIWKKNGFIFSIVKILERHLFINSDHIVTLTKASVSKIFEFNYWNGKKPKITVIPTCADLNHFKPPKNLKKSPFIFGYVGSFGTWYMMKETLLLFSAILRLREDSRMIIVNRNEHNLLISYISKLNLPLDRFDIINSSHKDVVNHIQSMHAASALIKPCFSKIASAPTKLAEYLGCGVPCVGNYGVGDFENILETNKVGIVLRGFDINLLNQAASDILRLAENYKIRDNCRMVAKTYFSLKDGVKSYRSIYEGLLNYET